MSSSPDISNLYREFTNASTEVLAENAVATADGICYAQVGQLGKL